MIKQLAIRCPRCHLALQATAVIISKHFIEKHNIAIDEISIKELLVTAVPFGELKSTATKNILSKISPLKQEVSNTRSGLKKRRKKLKNASLELPGIESLTPKKRLARLFGPDDPESYYATLQKDRLFLQGGSPGLGKRK